MVDVPKPLEPARAVALVDLLARLHGRFAGVAAEATATSPLTPGEGAALRVVAAASEGLSQSSWGRRLGVSRQRAHALAEGLVARGLLTVAPAGRASRVRITASGAAAVAAQATQLGEAVSARLAGLPAATAAAAIEALEALGEALA